MDDATLLGELRATHKRVDEAMTRMEAIHRETAVRHEETLGRISLLDQKVDLRHNDLKAQVDDVCERTDQNAANLEMHAAADAKKFGEIETRRQVTRARIGMLALLTGSAGYGLKDIWAKVVAIFSH